VVAARKRDIEGPTPGAVEAVCSLGCGETVMLARASRKRVALGWRVGCAPCVEAAEALGFQPERIEYPTAAEMADAAGLTEKN
jgi:hypothetical protein